MRKLALILCALAFGAAAGPAPAATPAGSALGVKPAAGAARGADRVTLVVGADIFIGDRVETGPEGQVQILFADDTELVVGPGSALVIEDYLLRNDGSAGSLAVEMLSGAFRFATGKSGKDRYRIDTPTGTIGVRGTAFDVVVDRDKVTRILLFHGAVRFCATNGACETLTSFCQLGQIGRSEARLLGDTREIGGAARAQLKGEFIYAMNQAPLLRRFWVAAARDCLNTPPAPPPPSEDKSDSGPGRTCQLTNHCVKP